MDNSDWKFGGCFCGDVRFKVRGQAIWKAGCTCTSCMKMHAAPYVVWAGFDQVDFEITKGDLQGFHSSPHAVREFCGRCGSTLTYRKVSHGDPELEHAASIVYISVASLDDPSVFPPDKVVHGQEMIRWLNLDASIPIHDFVSPDAGNLQFGGLSQDAAAELAKSRFGVKGQFRTD
jgi:hypothetical protein